MCGIAGFVGHGDLDTLKRMTDAIRHRGPDGEGHWRHELALSTRTGGRITIISPLFHCSTGAHIFWYAKNTFDILGAPDTLGIVGSIKQTSMPKILRITHIVKATGLSKSTLLRYEEEGKIPHAKRDGRKWRYYSEQDRNRIVAILKKLKLM